MGRVPSDGGTNLVGASDLSFLTSSSACRTPAPIVIGSTTLVNVLRHAGEDLIYLVRGGIGRDVNLQVDVYSGSLLVALVRVLSAITWCSGSSAWRACNSTGFLLSLRTLVSCVTSSLLLLLIKLLRCVCLNEDGVQGRHTLHSCLSCPCVVREPAFGLSALMTRVWDRVKKFFRIYLIDYVPAHFRIMCVIPPLLCSFTRSSIFINDPKLLQVGQIRSRGRSLPACLAR